MSCFVMEPRALAAISRGLETILNSGFSHCGIVAPRALYDALENAADQWGYYDEKKIYAELYALNIQAYAGRYNVEEDTTAPDFPDDVPRLLAKPTYNSYWRPSADFWKYYKLLDCYIYQTSEDATREQPLYLALLAFSRSLAAYLVRNSAAYDAAEWGRL